jgi:hypothetical protein
LLELIDNGSWGFVYGARICQSGLKIVVKFQQREDMFLSELRTMTILEKFANDKSQKYASKFSKVHAFGKVKLANKIIESIEINKGKTSIFYFYAMDYLGVRLDKYKHVNGNVDVCLRIGIQLLT